MPSTILSPQPLTDMMQAEIRIGTRESELAVWQANHVKDLLHEFGYQSTLVYIKSDGDIDLQTPLYELGVQGIFTRSLDAALLNNRIDIAVHSMKDVPTMLPAGVVQAAVLKRGNYKDLFVFHPEEEQLDQNNIDAVSSASWRSSLTASGDMPSITEHSVHTIATSSIRRKAQWLNRYPNHTIENLRGNVNTRLKKLASSQWKGAIFAAAGLERIGLKPVNSVELDWMLPAPAQGAIMVVCRQEDAYLQNACSHLNDQQTALCTKIERDFLRQLAGGCSTPISALAEVQHNEVYFKGSILSVDGDRKAAIEKRIAIEDAIESGITAAKELLLNGGKEIADSFK